MGRADSNRQLVSRIGSPTFPACRRRLVRFVSTSTYPPTYLALAEEVLRRVLGWTVALTSEHSSGEVYLRSICVTSATERAVFPLVAWNLKGKVLAVLDRSAAHAMLNTNLQVSSPVQSSLLYSYKNSIPKHTQREIHCVFYPQSYHDIFQCRFKLRKRIHYYYNQLYSNLETEFN